ncbi:MAG: hypothetical protein AAF530_03100 [Pseudomonadota bacterium]
MEAAVNDIMRPALGGSSASDKAKNLTVTVAKTRPDDSGERLTIGSENNERGLRDLGPGGPSADLTFGDLLDVANPLHHIPGIASVYREITGDEIGGPARMIGSMIYGGPMGLLVSMANIVSEETSGKDLGAHVMAFATGGDVDDPGQLEAPSLATSEPPQSGPAPQSAASNQEPPNFLPLQASAVSSPMVASRDQALTGLAALQAFAADLHSEKRPATPAAAPSGPVQDNPLAQRADRPPFPNGEAAAVVASGSVPRGSVIPVAQAVPPAEGEAPVDFAQKMLQALDKYESLTDQRQAQEDLGRRTSFLID